MHFLFYVVKNLATSGLGHIIKLLVYNSFGQVNDKNANSKNDLPQYSCLSSIASHHGMETASTQGVTLFPLRS